MLIDINTLSPKDDVPRIVPDKGYKKRILFVNEGSILNTGFSVYGKNVISRLYDTGKFSIYELASYCTSQDPRWLQQGCWWEYQGNMPDWVGIDKLNQRFIENKEQAQIYYGPNYKTNQFGEWRFASALLHFKPDLVALWTDNWMGSYILKSPLRKNTLVCWMPPVDG